MKRIASILCMLVLLVCPNIVYASVNEAYEVETLSNSGEDYSEIVKLDEQIKQMLNDIREEMNVDSLPSDYKIDYTTAKKIYVDTDIFSLDTSKKEDIMKSLEEGTYMWLLILNIEDITYQINISKGLPLDESIRQLLTEKEIEKIKAEEGKWSIAGIEVLEGRNINYEALITKELENINYEPDAEVLLCGGLKNIYQPVALVMNHEDVELLIPLYDLEINGTKNQIARIKPVTAGEDDEVYLYQKVKDAVNRMGGIDENSVGGGAYIELGSEKKQIEVKYLIAGVMVFIVGAVAMIYYNSRKHKLQ